MGDPRYYKNRTSVTNSPLMSWYPIYPLLASSAILPTLTVLAGYNTEGLGQRTRDRGDYALLYQLASPLQARRPVLYKDTPNQQPVIGARMQRCCGSHVTVGFELRKLPKYYEQIYTVYSLGRYLTEPTFRFKFVSTVMA